MYGAAATASEKAAKFIQMGPEVPDPISFLQLYLFLETTNAYIFLQLQLRTDTAFSTEAYQG